MRFKSIIACILIGCPAYTHAAWTNLNYLKGLYIGIGAGANFFSYDDQYEFDPNKVLNTTFYDRTYELNISTFDPNVTIGYIRSNEIYYVGLEFNANFTNNTLSQNKNITNNNNYSLGNTYSLWGKFGVKLFDRASGYGLLGATTSQLKRQISFTGPFQPLNMTSVSESRTIWGPVLGVGIEHILTDNWHIALEYSHVFYNKVNYALQNSIYQFLGTIGNDEVTLSQNTVMLKAIYYF